MNKRLFSNPLGDDMSPFGFHRKCAATGALLALTALGVGASAASAANNRAAQVKANEMNKELAEDTNKTNLQIARETNDMSQAQFNRNMEWLREQFGKQRQFALEDRDYNAPSQVVQRLRAAGLNPAVFFGNGQYQTTPVSSVGAPSQSSFQAGYSQAPHVEPEVLDFSGISEGIGRTVEAYQQGRMIDASIQKTGADTQIARADAATRLIENMARIRNIYSDTAQKLSQRNLTDKQREYLSKQMEQLQGQIDLLNRSFDTQLEALQLGNKKLRSEIKVLDANELNIKADTVLKRIDANIKPILAQANLRLSNAQISQIGQNIAESVERVKGMIQQGVSVSKQMIEQDLKNAFMQADLPLYEGRAKLRTGVYKRSKAVRVIDNTCSYLSDWIFSGIVKAFR